MLEDLPLDVRESLAIARKRGARGKSRLRLQVGHAVFPIVRIWEGGLSLDASLAPGLRGLVDVYDGARHLCQCLIVASTVEEGELICEFKRSTPATDRAPLDFWQDENRPVGYLPRA